MRAIRPLGTLHLTIGVMSLTKPARVEAAIALLMSQDMASILRAVKEEHAGAIEEAAACESEVGKDSEPPMASEHTPIQMNQALSSPPLTLSFKGLKSMHSAKSTSLLYTPPTDPSGRLYPFSQELKDQFTRKGFMFEEKRALRLHATILNTIYAGKVYPRRAEGDRPGDTRPQEPEFAEAVDRNGTTDEEQHGQIQPARELEEHDHSVEQHGSTEPVTEPQDPKGKKKKKGKRKKQPVKFDARELIDRYAGFEWARDVEIERVAICEMGAKKTTDEKGEVVGEEYTEIASVPLYQKQV